MKYYSQYGEENVLLQYFNQKKNGVVFDIGAADGTRYSNSRFLIENCQWSGVLVEPHPVFFKEIENLYRNNENVRYKNAAVHEVCGRMPFYVYGMNNLEPAQVSTLSPMFRDRVISLYGNGYEEKSIEVEVVTLKSLFEEFNVSTVDFLSIDCEGNDMNVLKSNDWKFIRPHLICVEHSMPQKELDSFMIDQNYKLYTRTVGNSFYTAE